MRLLHVIDSLATGGAERVAVNLCHGLAARGHDVHLATTRAEGALLADVDAAVHHVHLARERTIDVGAVRRLHRYLADHRVELVHAHGTSAFFSLAAVAGRRHPPTIYHDHFGGDIATRTPVLPYRALVRRTAANLAVNPALRRWAVDVAKARPERCFVLPNFSLLDLSGPRRATAAADPVEIVAVGNLRPQKDYPTLLRAFAALPASSAARLSIAGSFVDAAETARVRREVTRLGLDDRVRLLGGVRDVASLLLASDVGVSSSGSEGFPLSVLEYGLAGLAVVATDGGGTDQILDGGAAGVLVPPGDADALAGGLERLVTSADERARLGARLRAHLEANFSEERVVDDLLLIYDRVRSM
jgi:glycosyltransferase involved in cell wall biosynthesis